MTYSPEQIAALIIGFIVGLAVVAAVIWCWNRFIERIVSWLFGDFK